MDLVHLLTFLTGLFGVIVLGLTYTYIDKMEKMGCACSIHPYRDFIKTWSLVALFVVLVGMFAPVSLVHQFDSSLGRAYAYVSFAFLMAHLVYIVMTLMYIDDLIKKKCACSQDIRRELLYIWFILRALVIFSGLLIVVFIPIGATSMAAVNSQGKNIMTSTTNPLPALRKLPKSLKKSFSRMK
jgi:hypothetical protein